MSALRIGNRGVTAVEFAVLALPLVLLALGAIEFGLQAATASALDFGARAAARTGITGGGYNLVTQIIERQKSLKDAALAASGGWLYDPSKLLISEKSYDTIAEAQADPNSTDLSKGLPGPGGPKQYVRYRLSYVQPLWVPAKLISDFFGGKDSITHISTVLVTNEPFPIN